jgi:AraC-like DNA-binding protein
MDTTCERPILASLPGVSRVRAGDPAAGALGNLLEQLLRERSNPRPGSEFAGDRYAELVLVEVMRATHAADDAPRARWLQMISDLRDTGGSIAALATHLGVRLGSSFNHAFTRTLGMSPSEYRALHASEVKLRTAW